MLEMQILFQLGARQNEDQVCRDRLQRIPLPVPKSNAGQAWGPARLEGLVCSGDELKDAATEETEGATTLTVATYRPARAILKDPDTGPHKST